jgi:hypothetical protein
MKKVLMIVAVIVVVVAAFIIGARFSGREDSWICQYGSWVKHGNPTDSMPTTECLATIVMKEGVVTKVESDLLTVKNADNNIERIIVDTPTVIVGMNNETFSLSDLSIGFTVAYEGTRVNGDTIEGTKIILVSAPNIIVSQPGAEETLVDSFTLVGRARTFESHVNYRLTDASGQVLANNVFIYEAEDMGIFGDFSLNVDFAEPTAATGTLEVFQGSAKDGSEIDKVTIPVRFNVAETTKIKVFFNNTIFDPNLPDCSKVYGVERQIIKTARVGESAILELLKGPTATEVEAGYLSNLPSTKITLKSLTIRDGVAYADFDEALQKNVGGSCRVAAIRSQITETLKQFPTVKSVVISVGGEVDEALQP